MSEFEAAANSHGWFAAVIPAGARRFRVRDGSLAAMLTAAGADVVEDAPDVEIAAAEDLRGDAPYAVVPFAPRLPEGNLRLLRIAKRLGAFAQAQLGVLRARRVLRRRGYPVTAVVRWDIEQVLRRTDVRGPRARLRPVERLPGAAVVIGSRLP